MRRMDRYKEENTIRESRSEKKKELYKNSNKYTNITDVTNANVYEIDNNHFENKEKTRESYQKMRMYQNVEEMPKVKKDLEDFKHLYQRNEKKVYDINSVLEDARKNKQQKDDLDEKRKLKHTSYNILAGVNLEELLKYREEKKNRIQTEEEKEIRELVDTIASKTLAGEIDKATTVDLLSDLMATNMLDKVASAKELDKKDEEEKVEDTKELSLKEQIDDAKIKELDKEEDKSGIKGADTDFYTRSMDLSEEDFDMDKEFADTGLPLVAKVIIFILIITVIAVAAYFIYQKM